MTFREISAIVNKTGLLRVEAFHIPVVVKDARQVFDRTDYLVVPTDPNATGHAWVSSDRVNLNAVLLSS